MPIHMWADRRGDGTKPQRRHRQSDPARSVRTARERADYCSFQDPAPGTSAKTNHSSAHPQGVVGAAAAFVRRGAREQCEPLLSFRTPRVALPLAHR